MKNILVIIILCTFSKHISCQNNAYNNLTKMITDEGWSIQKSTILTLKPGQEDNYSFPISPGRQYKVFFMSDNEFSVNADVWVYDHYTKELLDKDEEKDMMAIADFYAEKKTVVTVVGKNVESTSSYGLKFYILMVYKQIVEQPVSKYDFSTKQKIADFLNSTIFSAQIGFSEPSYTFSVKGKMDFEKSSIQFIVKNEKLYIKMNIPKNGNCDYGLKEILSEFTGSSGSGPDYFYLSFKYVHECEGSYTNIFAYFQPLAELDRDYMIESLGK